MADMTKQEVDLVNEFEADIRATMDGNTGLENSVSTNNSNSFEVVGSLAGATNVGGTTQEPQQNGTVSDPLRGSDPWHGQVLPQGVEPTAYGAAEAWSGYRSSNLGSNAYGNPGGAQQGHFGQPVSQGHFGPPAYDSQWNPIPRQQQQWQDQGAQGCYGYSTAPLNQSSPNQNTQAQNNFAQQQQQQFYQNSGWTQQQSQIPLSQLSEQQQIQQLHQKNQMMDSSFHQP